MDVIEDRDRASTGDEDDDNAAMDDGIRQKRYYSSRNRTRCQPLDGMMEKVGFVYDEVLFVECCLWLCLLIFHCVWLKHDVTLLSQI